MTTTARHCPGCRGYVHGWAPGCEGVSVPPEGADFIVPDVVPPLRFRDRLRILFGQPVFLGVAAGPLGEPFAVQTWEAEIERWKDAG